MAAKATKRLLVCHTRNFTTCRFNAIASVTHSETPNKYQTKRLNTTTTINRLSIQIFPHCSVVALDELVSHGELLIWHVTPTETRSLRRNTHHAMYTAGLHVAAPARAGSARGRSSGRSICRRPAGGPMPTPWQQAGAPARRPARRQTPRAPGAARPTGSRATPAAPPDPGACRLRTASQTTRLHASPA